MKYTTTVEKTEEVTKETKFDVGDVVRAEFPAEVAEFKIQSIKVYPDEWDEWRVYYKSIDCNVIEKKLTLVRKYNN